jgi:hypothetical protein
MPIIPNRIGSRRFTDGVERPVFEDAAGQFVLDGTEKVYGSWLLPQDEPDADVPIVVQRDSR